MPNTLFVLLNGVRSTQCLNKVVRSTQGPNEAVRSTQGWGSSSNLYRQVDTDYIRQAPVINIGHYRLMKVFRTPNIIMKS